jgi:chemotaxis protein MotB
MASFGRRRQRPAFDYWPGFVDALATLLIVIIFLILVFVLAQFYLGQALSGRDKALAQLSEQILQLADLLNLEKQTTADLKLSVDTINTELKASLAARDEAVGRLQGVMSERDALVARLNEATQRLGLIATETQRAAKDLEDANKVIDADRAKIELQLKELAQLQADIEALKTVRADLEKQVAGLAQTVKERDAELTATRDRSKELEARLSTAEERTALAQREIAQRDIRLSELLALGDAGRTDLAKEKQLSADAQRQVELLNQQIAALRQQLGRIQAALDVSESKTKEQDVQIVDLGRRLNLALASKVEELARFRSEFFGRLRQALGDRPDIRVVGDRFVFQSEVLFDVGSAEIGPQGRMQLAKLAVTLREIAVKIPNDLNWILRVDGHTDRARIRTAQFPSNWELSTARAIAVVKFLIDQGVGPERLAATGFGEFQPLDARDDDASRARNRRIELKLTDR